MVVGNSNSLTSFLAGTEDSLDSVGTLAAGGNQNSSTFSGADNFFETGAVVGESVAAAASVLKVVVGIEARVAALQSEAEEPEVGGKEDAGRTDDAERSSSNELW